MQEDSVLDSLLGDSVDPVQAGVVLRQVGASDAARGPELLAELDIRRDAIESSDPAIVAALLRGIHLLILRGDASILAETPAALIASVESALPVGCPNRHLLLHLLILQKTPESLRLGVERLTQSPPTDWVEAAQVLTPLMQSRQWSVDDVFPRIFAGLEHVTLAAPLLDVANYVTRAAMVRVHPALDRVDTLNRLLSGVVRSLERFEADPSEFGDDVPSVQQRLSHAVALAVSLCDAIGLVGHDASIPKLEQAMQLKHRRVQCEAAGALARVRHEAGRQRLIELASEPSARLRAIAYAEELGFEDQIDAEFKTPQALAESEVALWLSQPDRFGMPPTSVETIDHRSLMWPSYQDPVNCFLVRFHYDMGTRSYSNVAIAGPATFAFACDVADMHVDDIYAMYAGWHAEHGDIFMVPSSQFNVAQSRVVQKFQEQLEREGYENLRPELFGVFLDEHAAVFVATREDKACRVLTDGLETITTPLAGRHRPAQGADVWNLYKGRKMLRTFNS